MVILMEQLSTGDDHQDECRHNRFSFVTTFNNLTGATINFNGGELRQGPPPLIMKSALAFSSGTFKLNSGVTFNYKTGSTVSGTVPSIITRSSISVKCRLPSTMNVINTTAITGR
ncbi:MAG: hypothetical protein IPP25_21800 [Saprospiraceae bacterium]|nr:hypothetical protein [Candidatus Opimibacter skivensis]